MQPVIAFTKVALPYGWLGNMAPFPIRYGGMEWRTSEALFQAMRFAYDDPIREKIREEKSPMGAKFTAKANSDSMVVVPLSRLDVANMRRVLRMKLEQHPELVKRLLETGDSPIIEDVTSRKRAGNHRFWGAALEDGKWIGENTLGKLWMELRQKVKK